MASHIDTPHGRSTMATHMGIAYGYRIMVFHKVRTQILHESISNRHSEGENNIEVKIVETAPAKVIHSWFRPINSLQKCAPQVYASLSAHWQYKAGTASLLISFFLPPHLLCICLQQSQSRRNAN